MKREIKGPVITIFFPSKLNLFLTYFVVSNQRFLLLLVAYVCKNNHFLYPVMVGESVCLRNNILTQLSQR